MSSPLYATDTGINGLVMPIELCRIINDFARVKKPDKIIGKNGCCKICFGKRPCKKLPTSHYCKGCYYEYGGGDFNYNNSYEIFHNCVKCDMNIKNKAYKNCPLCVVCYMKEKKEIYKYKDLPVCSCGSTKGKGYIMCYDCNKIRTPSERLKDVVKLYVENRK